MRIMPEYLTPTLRAQETRPWRAVPTRVFTDNVDREQHTPFHPGSVVLRVFNSRQLPDQNRRSANSLARTTAAAVTRGFKPEQL